MDAAEGWAGWRQWVSCRLEPFKQPGADEGNSGFLPGRLQQIAKEGMQHLVVESRQLLTHRGPNSGYAAIIPPPGTVGW